jgi:hypothetical protein
MFNAGLLFVGTIGAPIDDLNKIIVLDESGFVCRTKKGGIPYLFDTVEQLKKAIER